MIFSFACSGLFLLFLLIIFSLLFEGEDARKIKYYTNKMKYQNKNEKKKTNETLRTK